MAPKNTHKRFDTGLKINRDFGVEVECIRTKSRDENDNSIRHTRTNHFDSVDDGSLPRGTGEEKRSVILKGEDGLKAIHTLSDLLKKNSYTVNAKCGLHVHVNAGDLSGKSILNVAKFINVFDDVIFSLMPPNRRKNRYCKKYIAPILPYDARRLPQAEQLKIIGTMSSSEILNVFKNRSDRYYGFNTASLDRHHTLEFRYHSGTIDSKKIINWVKVCLAIVDNWHGNTILPKKRVKATRANVVRFCRLLKLDETVTAHVLSRWSKNNISKQNNELAIGRILTAVN